MYSNLSAGTDETRELIIARNHPSRGPAVPRDVEPTVRARGVTQSLYYPTLDGLRFIAFLLVFLHHLPPAPVAIVRPFQEEGWVGVHLFLLLSAFLLTSLLRSEYQLTGRVSVSHFYIRRCLRIWPLYFLFCLGITTYTLIAHPERTFDWLGLAGLLLFVDNIHAGIAGYNQVPFSGHLWTISLEEQFYAVLPFLVASLLAIPNRFRIYLLGCWAMFVGTRTLAVALEAHHPLIWTSVVSADALLLGTFLAITRVPFPRSATGHALVVVCGVALLFSAGFMPPIQTPGLHQIVAYTLIALGAGALTIAALHAPLLRVLKTAPFRYLGKISYGLYVFHLLGIAIGSKMTQVLAPSSSVGVWLILAASAMLATVIVAAASYALVESKFLRLKTRFEAVRSRPV